MMTRVTFYVNFNHTVGSWLDPLNLTSGFLAGTAESAMRLCTIA